MKRFSLSEWAIGHRALVAYFMLVIAVAGIGSYLRLGRSEDPDFTVKTMVVQAGWPGASVGDTLEQITDRLERKLQETPSLDYLKSYTTAGQATIFVNLKDSTPPAQVPDIWYQVRKKVGDIRGDLPAAIIGPNFNDEFGDVYSAIYMLSADGLSLADLKARAEDIRQRLLRVPNVNKADIIGERPEKIFIELAHAKLATLGITVVTTCDARVQKLARDAVEKGLVDLDARQGYRKPLAHLKTPQQIQAHGKKLAKDFPSGPSRDKIVEGVITEMVGGKAGPALVEKRTQGRAPGGKRPGKAEAPPKTTAGATTPPPVSSTLLTLPTIHSV